MFLIHFVPEANDDEQGITQDTCPYHKRNQSIHVTDSMVLSSLSAGHQRKTSAVKFLLCQMAVN
jgi:hypothetical protein